ncbi:MAG: RsmG family class I SAM-dependent methyltransferase [Acidimicrobiia bacterium]
MKHEEWIDVANHVGYPLKNTGVELLGIYERWLRKEALVAGGIGPTESDRLGRRHITDSLLFARFLPADCLEVLDLGSGVGLPGIPLAVLRPEVTFRLVDRSGRRCELARRAVRVLNLKNVVVEQRDFADLEGKTRWIVSRASLPPDQAFSSFGRLLEPGGVAILGGSWRERPEYPGWVTIEVGSEILDQPVWILMMRNQ